MWLLILLILLSKLSLMTSFHFLNFKVSAPAFAFVRNRFDHIWRSLFIFMLKLNLKNNWIVVVIIHRLNISHLSSLNVTLLLHCRLLLQMICLVCSLACSSYIFFLNNRCNFTFAFLQVIFSFILGRFIYIYLYILLKFRQFLILQKLT